MDLGKVLVIKDRLQRTEPTLQTAIEERESIGFVLIIFAVKDGK